MSQTLAVANGDLDINALGSGDLIQGRDKASQDTAEILLSDYDAERDYGGKLQTMSVPGAGAKSIISTELQAIMRRLQNQQALDPAITAAEKIASVPGIDVQSINETDYLFRLQLRTADQGTITMTDTVRYRRMQLSHTWPHGTLPFTLQ